MALSLHTIQASDGSRKRKKRLGRGLASRGAKSGRGQKGQKARSGASGSQRIGIRQFMLATPKLRGFKSQHVQSPVVNVSEISKHFKAGEHVTPSSLKKKGLVATESKGVKILGNGEVTVAVIVKDCAVSKSAEEKLTKAGGTIRK